MNEQIRFAQLQLAQVPIPARDSAQVIANAEIPATPYTPDYVRNIALAIAAGLALGVGVAFLREQFDDRMSGPDDMEEQIGAPALAVVPHFNVPRKRRDEFLVGRDQPKSPPAEAYRTVRTNIEFMSRTNQLKVVGIVSPSLSEGKTTTTANLSHSLASSGKRVVALSCDLRKPKMHRLFGLSNDVGLTDVLTQGVAVGSAVQRVAGVPTLRVLTSGPVPSNPAEMLGSDEMHSLLSSLREVADFVIVDTAPVLAVSDALVLSPLCDGVVMVVDASYDHEVGGAHRARAGGTGRRQHRRRCVQQLRPVELEDLPGRLSLLHVIRVRRRGTFARERRQAHDRRRLERAVVLIRRRGPGDVSRRCGS